jgi:hypothetical protein
MSWRPRGKGSERAILQRGLDNKGLRLAFDGDQAEFAGGGEGRV